MKIIKIQLDRLRNEEWFNFLTEFKRFVEEHSAKKLNIGESFAAFTALYDEADGVLEKIRKSGITTVMMQYDRRRDEIFRGLVNAVKSAQTHYDAGKREATLRLEPLLSHYGNLSERPLNEETAAIYNFLQELRGAYAAAASALDLLAWANELENANHEFEEAVKTRTEEAAGKTDLKMLDVRRRTDRCYRDIVERLQALMLINGEDAYTTFVKKLNINTERYIAAINRRKGAKNGETEKGMNGETEKRTNE